jgi:hypothetical protein
VDVLYVWQTSTERPVTAAREEAERSLADFVGDLAPVSGGLHRLTECGDPYMTVSSVAQLGAYGALVIPGTGPDGSLPALSRALLYTCRVPSLVVPAAYRRRQGAPLIERLLLPEPAAEESSAALEAALVVSERSAATLEVLCSGEAAGSDREWLARAEKGAAAIELREVAGDLTAAIEARATRADYQLFVCAVRGAGFGQEIHAPESDRVIARQRCPVLALRRGT